MRLLSGQEAGNANLEWFSIKPDGTRILVNDVTNPDALLAFRARTFTEPPHLNVPTLSGGLVAISWTGNGVLEETTSVTGGWGTSPGQDNPQLVPATGGSKFYRVRGP